MLSHFVKSLAPMGSSCQRIGRPSRKLKKDLPKVSSKDTSMRPSRQRETGTERPNLQERMRKGYTASTNEQQPNKGKQEVQFETGKQEESSNPTKENRKELRTKQKTKTDQSVTEGILEFFFFFSNFFWSNFFWSSFFFFFKFFWGFFWGPGDWPCGSRRLWRR